MSSNESLLSFSLGGNSKAKGKRSAEKEQNWGASGDEENQRGTKNFSSDRVPRANTREGVSMYSPRQCIREAGQHQEAGEYKDRRNLSFGMKENTSKVFLSQRFIWHRSEKRNHLCCN